MSLRNVGSGLAVIHGWRTEPGVLPLSPTSSIDQRRAGLVRPDTDQFRLQGRDLYVPPADVSFWQAAIREPEDPDRAATVEVIEQRGTLTIDLLYGDHEGGQRTISRFMVTHVPGNDTDWVCSVVRHWNLDRDDPR
jgi:hypothetical protein